MVASDARDDKWIIRRQDQFVELHLTSSIFRLK